MEGVTFRLQVILVLLLHSLHRACCTYKVLLQGAEAVTYASAGSLHVHVLQDRRGGSGKLLNLLRVNNDLFCDLAALATFDDTSRPGRCACGDQLPALSLAGRGPKPTSMCEWHARCLGWCSKR